MSLASVWTCVARAQNDWAMGLRIMNQVSICRTGGHCLMEFVWIWVLFSTVIGFDAIWWLMLEYVTRVELNWIRWNSNSHASKNHTKQRGIPRHGFNFQLSCYLLCNSFNCATGARDHSTVTELLICLPLRCTTLYNRLLSKRCTLVLF